jgi:hypothetical protein
MTSFLSSTSHEGGGFLKEVEGGFCRARGYLLGKAPGGKKKKKKAKAKKTTKKRELLEQVELASRIALRECDVIFLFLFFKMFFV